MSKYGFVVNLNTEKMQSDGWSKEQIDFLLYKELPRALLACGCSVEQFNDSFYCIDAGNANPLGVIMKLPETLKAEAPAIFQDADVYMNHIHIFKMEDCSNMTEFFKSS